MFRVRNPSFAVSIYCKISSAKSRWNLLPILRSRANVKLEILISLPTSPTTRRGCCRCLFVYTARHPRMYGCSLLAATRWLLAARLPTSWFANGKRFNSCELGKLRFSNLLRDLSARWNIKMHNILKYFVGAPNQNSYTFADIFLNFVKLDLFVCSLPLKAPA